MLIKLSEISWVKYSAEVDPAKPHADRDRYRRTLVPLWVNPSHIGIVRIAPATPPTAWKPEGTPQATNLVVMGEWLSVDETPEQIAALAPTPPLTAEEKK